jgi:hypothetical protein
MLQPEDAGKAGAGVDEEQEEVFKDLDDEDQEGGPSTAAAAVAGDAKGDPAAQGVWPKPGYYDMQKRCVQVV